jgi:DNA repair exonuclease SbcCD nuclease subunit
MLGHDRAETVTLDQLGAKDVGVAIHGQSFPQPAVLEDLSAGYPPAIRGLFNIGLLHTSAAGYNQHARYAPCTVEGLRTKGYDYWALGHIHQQEILHPAHPVVAFSGNTQGRHIKERGPKGCLLVEVDDRGEAKVTPRALNVLRWEICTVDAADAATADEVLDRFRRQLAELRSAAGATPLAVRVELCGATPAHEQLAARPQHWTHQIRAAALEAEAGAAWIEQVLIRTSPPRDAEQADAGPLGAMLQYLDELRRSDESLAALHQRLTELERKLPHELADKLNGQIHSGPALWDEVEHLLVGRLQAASGSR